MELTACLLESKFSRPLDRLYLYRRSGLGTLHFCRQHLHAHFKFDDDGASMLIPRLISKFRAKAARTFRQRRPNIISKTFASAAGNLNLQRDRIVLKKLNVDCGAGQDRPADSPRGKTEDKSLPAVYLCQVNEQVSCGACCGLYNVAGLSRPALETMLCERTAAFAQVPRNVQAIEDFQLKIERRLSRRRPFADFYHCPFTGLLGENGLRVGCLLHPQAPGNDGIDWRGLSYYGGMACRTYFCPSCRQLPQAYLQILGRSLDHWYPFGLIVTERRLLSAFFKEIENRIGRRVKAEDFPPESKAAAVLRKFAQLKIDWPHRRKNAPGPCNYFFENGEYPRPPVERAGDNIPSSPFEDILSELDSGFSSRQELFAAEAMLEGLFQSLSEALLF